VDRYRERISRCCRHAVSLAMDGIAKVDCDRSFALSVATHPRCAATVVVRRARMLAAARCPRSLQHALHELVARPRKGSRPEDHAAALIRSSWSQVPYPLCRCLEIFVVVVRSFG